jgi:hypothetical protein
VFAVQIPRALVDDSARPQWAPVQTGAQQGMARFDRTADLRFPPPPPSPAGQPRSWPKGTTPSAS